MKKLLIFILILIINIISVSASPVKESEENVIHVGTTALIEKAEYGEYNYDLLSSAVSELPLIYKDSVGVYHPLVASFSSTDPAIWSFTILEGMTWSDGVKVTARDILYTLIYEDENGSANLVDQKDSKGNVTKSKYVAYELSGDEMTITLTLRNANVRELSNMTSFRIVPEHLYSDGEITLSDKRTTCGPFVLSKFDQASGLIEFIPNTYYPEKSELDMVCYHLFSNEDTMYMALLNGDIAFTAIYNSGVSSAYIDVLAQSDTLNIISKEFENVPLALSFNVQKISSKELRNDISYALDYEELSKYIGGVNAKVANRGFVPSSTVGYIETPKLTRDLAKADELMKIAGYEKVDGYYTKDNKALELTLTYRLDKSIQYSGAELIKNQLEAFGIKINLDGLDSASYNAKTSNKFSDNNISFEIALFGYTANGMGMGAGLGTIYADKSHSVQGGCQVDDDFFKAALVKLESARNIDEYYEGAKLMQQYYQEYIPFISLYLDGISYAVSNKYSGYVVDSNFGINNVNTFLALKRN